jgi:NADPH2:quinone reductase
MKAAVYYENGPPSVLRYADMPDPVVGPTDVLIRVESVSIEGGDILSRQLVPPPRLPHIVGYQAAGEVVATGTNVKGIRVGQKVAAFNWSGSHAALFAVPQHFAYAVPDGLGIKIASTIPVTFGTADDALFENAHLQDGETVLIQGGAGGVGLAAIQLAKAAGAMVIATAASDERLDRLRCFGVDHGINYKRQDPAAEALRLTDGRGVDLLVDLVGGLTANALLTAIRYRGRISIVGAASGVMASFGSLEIASRGLTLLGVSFGREMHLPRVHAMIGRHLADAAAGRVSMPIEHVFPLSAAAEAHDHVQHGHPFGRVVMTP